MCSIGYLAGQGDFQPWVGGSSRFKAASLSRGTSISSSRTNGLRGRTVGRPEVARDKPRNRDESLLAFSPEATNQKLAQSRALSAIEKAFENGRYRIVISRTEIEPIQWIVILLLSAIILITIASVHIQQRSAMAVGLFTFSTAIAICLVLLMEYDRPFVPGGFVLSPTDYRDAIPD